MYNEVDWTIIDGEAKPVIKIDLSENEAKKIMAHISRLAGGGYALRFQKQLKDRLRDVDSDKVL